MKIFMINSLKSRYLH